jgi:flagellar biosynthesis GTPase FlhF
MSEAELTARVLGLRLATHALSVNAPATAEERRAEREQLRRAVDACLRSRAGGVVYAFGAPGSGKTTTVVRAGGGGE